MNLVFLRSVHHDGYIKANDQWGVCVGGGGEGGCHVKTSKLRKQSPYPYILIDHLCLDLDSLERARLPCQINRRL